MLHPLASHHQVLLQYGSALEPHCESLARSDLALVSPHLTFGRTASDHGCVAMPRLHGILAYP